ncbi:TetR/AcrR family transcriptional regulator [Plantibacter sp. YIM 135249]|uniref:TetR/AcrR family transcriptional regulator n=1 Tax=Plantibacter sp. YIM 135249 TaxID=3423918 RepID=UPI003D3395BA
MTTSLHFQRARRPEQVEARRTAILETARTMLGERPVAEISLRELSERVGLAKSNVLRYFDSREAIFLEILDESWTSWVDEVRVALEATDPQPGSAPHTSPVRPVVTATSPSPPPPTPRSGAFAEERRVAGVLAEALATNALLCELISVMSSVLERNITIEFARDFKRRAHAHSERFAALVAARFPELDDAAAESFAGGVLIIVAGLWSFASPTPEVAQAAAELGTNPEHLSFEANLREYLSTQLIGLTAQAGSSA